ncbi:YjjW family glycine radical enzyme activase [Petrocella sp. FN5]|uniref:YjjW family glycine radical enzyme activase n=1 Tax=Petrocella sp. FN5 TaxID=3032002 RepID=UPI0023DCAB86|nr:YjjW family glycine radical enzyme activase [Petrocella sp. FN5]MDF1618407.1 YjjW family glycine radical enzyme activase [Petrocella sp. FN5]
MNQKILVNQIIPFSNVDGEGNRCSIFVQGCQLNCLYCHNSETIQKCRHCGICVEHCPSKALSIESGLVLYNEKSCTRCDKCIMICPFQSTPKAKAYTLDDLMVLIKSYRPYIRGVTLSGGEPTLYTDFLMGLCKKIRSLGLTVYIDSNGFFDFEATLPLINNIDGFLLDIKAVDNIEQLCGVKGQTHLINLEKLLEIDKVIEVRTVLLNKHMDQINTLNKVVDRLKGYNQVPYRLIRAHVTGLKKAQALLIGDAIMKDEEFLAYGTYLSQKGFHNFKLQR